jgi:hypothetical protein
LRPLRFGVGETGTPKLFIKVKVSMDAKTTHLVTTQKGGHVRVYAYIYIAHERDARLSDETSAEDLPYDTCARAEQYVKGTEGNISDRGAAK